jgi:hypothetical protein
VRWHVPLSYSEARWYETASPTSRNDANPLEENAPKKKRAWKLSDEAKKRHELARGDALALCAEHVITISGSDYLFTRAEEGIKRKQKYFSKLPDDGFVCSYNLDANGIYVPGQPERLTLGAKNQTKPQDTQLRFQMSKKRVDVYSHILYALESSHAMGRQIDLSNIDVVTTVPALLALYRFRLIPESIHSFTLRTFGKTLFIDRNTALETPDAQTREFKNGKTTQDVDILKSSRHYQWHQMLIGDLLVLVLREVDAQKSAPPAESEPPVPLKPEYLPETVSVTRAGKELPDAEPVTVRAFSLRPDHSRWLPAVYFSGIHLLLSGEGAPKGHRRFKDYKLVDYKEKFHRFKKSHKLPDIVNLLYKLRDITRNTEQKACIAITEGDPDGRRVEIYRPWLGGGIRRDKKGTRRSIPPTIFPTEVAEKVRATFWPKVPKTDILKTEALGDETVFMAKAAQLYTTRPKKRRNSSALRRSEAGIASGGGCDKDSMQDSCISKDLEML